MEKRVQKSKDELSHSHMTLHRLWIISQVYKEAIFKLYDTATHFIIKTYFKIKQTKTNTNLHFENIESGTQAPKHFPQKLL